MFLNTNDRIINLKNVSNINVLNGGKRIVFNLNYHIQIERHGNPQKYISDYVYWDAINPQNMMMNLCHLEDNPYFIENFIARPNNNGFINLNEISSVKFAEKKNRVIFNMSHPISFLDGQKQKITSEFVYVDCNSDEEYDDFVKYVLTKLNN